jgi:hypothetical protein
MNSEYKKSAYDRIVDKYFVMHYQESEPEASTSEEEFQFLLTDEK